MTLTTLLRANQSPETTRSGRPSCVYQLIWTWSALVFALSLSGCDDPVKPSAAKYEVTFIYPDEGVTLGCSDDLNRSTPDVVDVSMTVNVSAPEGERNDLVLELRAEPEVFPPQRRSLTEGGRVIFSQLPLNAGDYTLTAALLNGQVERGKSEREVSVVIDAASPVCGVAESSLRFLTPNNGMVIDVDSDLDQDLTNGVQVEAVVEVEGPIVNVGNLVEIQVNGADPKRAEVVEGVARFESITLPLAGDQTLTALATGPNGLLETTIIVSVSAASCELTLTPAPSDGCDLGSTADLDTETPGLQAELRAQTTCAQVVWTVNGRTYAPVDVVDGEAIQVVTLNQGENSVSAVAQSASGREAEGATYVLDVDLTNPELSIDGFEELGVNQRGLDQLTEFTNDAGELVAGWRLSGFTSDLPGGSSISAEILSDSARVEQEIELDEDGRFNLNLEGTYRCGEQLILSAPDQCGGVHSSPNYSFCFDGVTPRLTIAEPVSLALINEDLDPNTEGLQTEMTIEVQDARGDVDYPIELRCSIGAGGAAEVLSDAPVLRSELEEVEPGVYRGSIRATLPRAERYTCAPAAMTGINEPILVSSIFRVITDEPIFEVLDPTVISSGNGRDYACFSDTLLIGGRARQFSEDDTQLNFTLSTQAGQVARFGQLTRQEGEYYSVQLDLSNRQLADGLYYLDISGVSGSLDISVIPNEPIPVLIDNEEPVIGPLSPADGRLTLAQDVNSDLSDCIQSTVEYSLSDASAERVCFSLNAGTERCVDRIDQGVVTSPVFNFLPGDNQLTIAVQDCALSTRTFDFTLTAEGCQAPLRIVNLSDGAGVTLSDDVTEDEDGIQLSLTLSGDPAESASVLVTTAGADPIPFGPVVLDNSGSAEVTVTIPTQEGSPLDVTLTPTSAGRGGQVVRVTSYQLTPQLNVRPITEQDECINQSFIDLSAAEGFQLRLIVDGEGISSGVTPRFAVYCANDEGGRDLVDDRAGTLINLGQSALITSDLLTFPDGACEVEVEARDVSGALISTSTSLQIDRLEPQIVFTAPAIDEAISLLNDADPDTPGIQFSTELIVCGAGGSDVTITTSPAQASGDVVISLEGAEECESVSAGELSFENGDQLLIASAVDQCGNVALYEQNVNGNTGVSLVITEPNDQELIAAGQDLDLETAGCQLEIEIASTGFTTLEGVTFALCATQQAGELSPLCGAQPDASQGGCLAQDVDGRDIVCPVALSDGPHELSIVSRHNGEDLRSAPVSVLVDCTPPRILSLGVSEDLDGDGCINHQERQNFNAAGSSARVNITFEVEGFEDDDRVNVRVLPSERSLGQAVIQDGRGTLESVILEEGDYQLYLSGIDRVGNTLPTPDSDQFVGLAVQVDTTAPAPLLLQPSAGECLGLDDDLDAAPGAQYQPQVSTGSVNSEVVALSLILDGVTLQRPNSALSTYSFDAIELSEGPHTLAVTSTDSCGNVGSVAGFPVVAGRPDWTAPIATSIDVDLTTPTLTLGGIVEGQVLSAEDDANGSPNDGFQVEITIDVAGLEAGREVKVYSGGDRIPTSPAQLIVSGVEAQRLNATLTLPPGPHALSADAEDLCDNNGVSPTTTITIDVEGCSSALTGLISGQLFGPLQGEVTPDNRLRIDVSGRVDLLDPACAGAQAELVLNGSEAIGSTTINPTSGEVAFNDVSVPEGEQLLAIRVRLDSEETVSIGKSILVDLTAPSQITVSEPQLTNGVGLILDDSNPDLAGQQFTLVAQVEESPATTTRTARLSINGVVLPSVELPAPDGDGITEIRIDDINAPPRLADYQLCVRDEVSNERCLSFELEGDPTAPSAVVFSSNVLNPRTPEVELSFSAPGDDQSGGDQVIAYEVRWSRSEINTELTWDAATALPDQVPTALPGAQETLTLSGFPPNEQVYISVRARDDVGRLGPARSALVDARLSITSATIAPSGGGVWATGQPLTEGNSLTSIGDFDGDGYDDLLFGISRGAASNAAVLFGDADLSVLSAQNLDIPPEMQTDYFGIEVNRLGDINGDGAPDIGVLGYTPSFSSAVAIYFGCTVGQVCDPIALRTADVVLTTNFTLRSSIAGAGDVSSRLGLGFDDIVIGGGRAVGPYIDPEMVVVIEGRDSWPATLDITSADEANGIYSLYTGIPKTGVQVAAAGDVNDDGAGDLLFSAGSNIDRLFLVYGGSTFGEGEEGKLVNGVWIYNDAQVDFIELSQPCADLGSFSFGTMIRGGQDLNGDLVSDFVVANRVDEVLITMNGDLTLLDCFKREEQDFSNPFDLAGDVNGDGSIDLIAANRSADLSQAGLVYVFYNNGAGVFGEDEERSGRAPSMRIERPLGSKRAAAGAGDMNGDGAPDVAVLVFNNDLNLYQVGVLY